MVLEYVPLVLSHPNKIQENALEAFAVCKAQLYREELDSTVSEIEKCKVNAERFLLPDIVHCTTDEQ